MPRPHNDRTHPLIGVSDNYADHRHDLRPEYTRAIADAGGLPVIIPFSGDESVIERTVSRMQGILLTGGCDIHPKHWGETLAFPSCHINEERDAYDFAIIKLCILHRIPILAICRGLQCVNVKFGGSLYQDMAAQLGSSFAVHDQQQPTETATHEVSFIPGTRTAQLLPQLVLSTNSHHHQAVKKTGNGLTVTGRSADGTVEALEADNYDIVAFQFHPERMTRSNPQFLDIFSNWIEHLR